VGGQPLCDADDGLDARVDVLVDRVGGKARGNKDHRRVRPGLLDGLGDGVEDRDPLEVLTALAGCDAGDDVRAVGAVAKRVEGALAAGRALDDELRLRVDDDRHQLCPFRALRMCRRRSSGRRAAP
jgi:hypothetical protein